MVTVSPTNGWDGVTVRLVNQKPPGMTKQVGVLLGVGVLLVVGGGVGVGVLDGVDAVASANDTASRMKMSTAAVQPTRCDI